MALFSDGPPAALAYLVQIDSFLLSVATTEGIDVTNKLQLAYGELEIEISAIFGREASIYSPVLGQAPLDLNHLALTSALVSWHAFRALEMVYRDAYFNQLNDRYKSKWVEFKALGQQSKLDFIDAGAGLVIDPLVQPGVPATSFESSTQTGGTVYFTVTFVNAEGEESTPAVVTEVVIPDDNVLVVGSPVWPGNAVNWNLYGGTAPSVLILQNAAPVALGQAWQYILPGNTLGPSAGSGQSPNVTRDLPRRIMRG